MDDVYSKIVLEIVEEQSQIIGPIAVERANAVEGLKLDWKSKSVELLADPRSVIDRLVEQYKQLFGQISVEVCREAVGKVASTLPHDQLPKSLQ